MQAACLQQCSADYDKNIVCICIHMAIGVHVILQSQGQMSLAVQMNCICGMRVAHVILMHINRHANIFLFGSYLYASDLTDLDLSTFVQTALKTNHIRKSQQTIFSDSVWNLNSINSSKSATVLWTAVVTVHSTRATLASIPSHSRRPPSCRSLEPRQNQQHPLAYQ